MTSLATTFLRLFFFVLVCLLPGIAKSGNPTSLSCSTSQNGVAVINEVNADDNFIEIYLLQSSDILDWSIYLDDVLIQNLGHENCTINGVLTPDNTGGTIHPAGTFIVCSTNINPSKGEVLLVDKTGTPSGATVIDYLGYGKLTPKATWSIPSECGTLFPTHDANNKDIARIPDGTGSLTDNDNNSTPGTTNSGGGGGGGGDTAAAIFNCVENGADGIFGKLYTKTTAQSFSFDIVALQDASTIETSFASGADHTVTVELVNAETIVSCDSYPVLSPAVSQSLTMTFSDSGIKASAAMSSNTAYKAVKCRVTDATDPSSIIGCSTDSFAIRPTAFTISSNLTNTGSTGTPKAKAGENFTLTATAGSGYTGTPLINSSNVQAHAAAIQTGTISGTFSPALPSSGVATGNDFTYSEVGSLRFTTQGIYDENFTAIDQNADCTDDFSNTLVAGKVGCKFGNTSTTAYFGRFTPDHFVLSNKNLEDRNNLSCSLDSSFTYIGEAFQTSFTLTAENSGNDTTQNYTGSFAKLGGSDFNFGAIDLADAVAPISATALSSQLGIVSSSGSWTNGIANMTAILGVSRTSQEGPFESFKLGIAPADSDGITVSSYDLDTSVPSDSNDRELLATTKIRFGRLNIENAHGSELLPLAVPVYTEYYNGTSFVINTDDTCTPISAPQLRFNGGTNPITVGSGTSTASISNSPLALGKAGLSLSAPGANNTGFVDINSDIFISSFPWLSYDWDGDGSHDNSPSARATFGIYKGNSQQIYFREVY